jgi:hypothetical protein
MILFPAIEHQERSSVRSRRSAEPSHGAEADMDGPARGVLRPARVLSAGVDFLGLTMHRSFASDRWDRHDQCHG